MGARIVVQVVDQEPPVVDRRLELAGELGLLAEESSLTQYDLYNSDECFLTGSGAEIMPVIQIDGRRIGDSLPGSITKRLINAYHEEILR